MSKASGTVRGLVLVVAALLGGVLARPAAAGPEANVDGLSQLFAHPDSTHRGHLRPQDIPDIYGPGHVSTVGNVWMKTTNIGTMGNPFTQLSSDPSAQWPGASGVEYLYAAYLYVGAKDATVSDPALLRRVSNATEWRPASLDPRDRIYTSFDGQVNGQRLSDDDFDGKIDEDPLDGWDNDGDGKVDEDYGAISQQEFSCVERDDTPQAIETPAAEKHVPRGLQVRQNTYAFSVPGDNDFTSVEWEIENVSGHRLDSVYVGIRFDQDVGPISRDRYYSDDIPEPRIPQGPDPTIQMRPDDPLNPNAPYLDIVDPQDVRYQNGACTLDTLHVNGFTLTDDDGDNGLTIGASTIQLLGMTTDPAGVKAPRRVGFAMYADYSPGQPYVQGGVPTNDQERYEAMVSGRNIDQSTGLINAEVRDRGDIGDYSGLCSVGPFLDFEPGEKVKVAWCLSVQEVIYQGTKPDELQKRYPKIIANAVAAQKCYRGSYESRQGLDLPGPEDFGRETCIYKVPGGPLDYADCHDDSVGASRTLKETECTWFDLDCNYCTGVPGQILKHWTAAAPPPSPRMKLAPGDRQVVIKWDNQSEYTPDPETGWFDFAGYKIWKASNWTRPVGSTGPGDNLWSLVATLDAYDPRYNPLILKNAAGDPDTVKVPVLLNRLTGEQLYPYDVGCDRPAGDSAACDTAFGKKPGFTATGVDTVLDHWPVIKYPIGRYQFIDHDVLNGFLYFYSVTAFDSTNRGARLSMQQGRQAAVEADGVVPQQAFTAAANKGAPFVVPNPYRGSSDWDLTPNATDPTGTHVDFFNLPTGWQHLRIYTVSGDLVQEIQPGDAQPSGKLQKESATDSQAAWNLISRNGQDVVSGIYIFSVDSPGGATQRGKFIIIR